MCVVAVREWRNRWELHVRPREIGNDQSLLMDMHSVNDRTRMEAIAAMAVLAENEAVMHGRVSARSEDRSEYKKVASWRERRVSKNLLIGVERLLLDKVAHVRVPSAIALYLMGKETKAVSVLAC